MTQKQIDAKINKIKMDIFKIDALRPGSLSKQYNICGVAGCRCKDPNKPKKHGPYFNLNYVHQGKKKTQFIREQFAKTIDRQNRNFRRFKELTQMWITLEIERSNLAMKSEIAKMDEKNKGKSS
jgi:hypothetical protein